MKGNVTVTMGIIGGGKSSLSEELAVQQNAKYFAEPDERNGDNPYLKDFYEEMKKFFDGEVKYNKYAGIMQLHLLGKRLSQFAEAQQIAIRGGNAVIDAGFYQDTCFARILARSGQMPEREFNTYAMLYRQMTLGIAIPSVVIRLMMSPKTAQKRIVKRYEAREGRRCEDVVSVEYLTELDSEIEQTANLLQQRGSHVITMAWDDDRGTPEDRVQVVQDLASKIISLRPADPFLNYHARIM